VQYEQWRLDPPGLSDFFVPVDHPQYEVVTAGHHLVWAFEADSWEEAMVVYFRRMAWEPYRTLPPSSAPPVA
jgi:hypothetical protein